MNKGLQILPTTLLKQYQAAFDPAIQKSFERLQESELSIKTFNFYVSVSAVFSSKIEGEQIELDSFIKHKRFGIKYLPDYTRKIDDLYDAYLFAQTNNLSATTLAKAHRFLTQHILHKQEQGKIRASNMFVVTADGKIEYAAASPSIVKGEMKKFHHDLDWLLGQPLDFIEVFFYAAMLHIVLLKIHPFADGNGRTARLLEKWFIAHKLGQQAWFLQSEKYYYENNKAYYSNIRQLGFEYETLDYAAALPFLQMLPNSIVAYE
jgi:Fic family protein